MRLDRLLSLSNYGSRTQVKAILRAGKVCVNGITIHDPKTQIEDPNNIHITVDGAPIQFRRYRYLCLNKPDGCLTAMYDKRLPTVSAFLSDQDIIRKVHPVGRLDYHTTGLLLFTNDGHLAHRLMSPRWHIKKVYQVEYDGKSLGSKEISLFEAGITLTDQFDKTIKLSPAKLELIDDHHCKITITEGKTHQIKRMLAAINRNVVQLHRESFGGLSLHPNQSGGDLRSLEHHEIEQLYALTQIKLNSSL